MNVVLNRTVVVYSDWCCDNLCGSHLQSQSDFDSEDDYRTGCRNVSQCQQQQSYSGLRTPRRTNSTYFWNDSCVQTFHRMYLIKTDEHEMTPSKKVVQQNCPFNFANIFVSPLCLLISLSCTSWADSCVVKINIFSFGKVLTWNWLDSQHWKALPEKNMLSKALYNSERNPILKKNIIYYRWKINEVIHPHF